MKSRLIGSLIILVLLCSLPACSLQAGARNLATLAGRLTKTITPTSPPPTPSVSATPSLPLDYPFSPESLHFGLASVKESKNSVFIKELKVSALAGEPRAIWYLLESQPGKYDWSSLDASIKWIQAQGVDTSVLLIPMNVFGEMRSELDPVLSVYKQNNNYQTLDETFIAFLHDTMANSRWTFYPNQDTLPVWLNFVHAMIQRYNGDGVDDMPGLKYPVRAWQFDYEFPLTGWGEGIQAYLSALKATYQAIKEVDPKASVVLAGLESSSARLFAFADGFIQDNSAGFWRGDHHTRKYIIATPILKTDKENYETLLTEGKDYYDVVDIHLLEEKTTFLDGKLEWIKKLLEKLALSKPVWCDEAGGPRLNPAGAKPGPNDPPFGVWTEQANAEYTVKIMVTAAYRGVDRVYYRLVDNPPGYYLTGPWTVMGLVDTNRYKKPSYYAYQQLISFLAGYKTAVLRNFSPYRLAEFEVGDNKVYVAWAETGESTFDLSPYLGSGIYTITPIVTQLQKNRNPVVPPAVQASAANITLNSTPVFIQAVAP